MNRWKNKLAATMLLFGGLAGCTRPLYHTLKDQEIVTSAGLPKNLENDPNAASVPLIEGHNAPPTIDLPDRPIRYMTLAESFAIAMESGNRGNQGVYGTVTPLFNVNNATGKFNQATADDLGTLQGNSFSGDDAIRAFALDPANVATNIEGALAKFDTRWISSMTWNKVDTATSNVLNNFTNGDTAAFTTGLFKPLPTGGTAGITFNTNYTKLSNPPSGFSVINPAYQPSAQVSFEQPLLRDYGIEINQLNASHPGSTQIAGLTPSGGRGEGILISRIRVDQQRADFERSINVMLINVENLYWSLYANYFALYASVQGLRQSYLTWQLRKSELDAGKATAHEVAQVRAQFASFRSQRIASLQQVLETERQFRGLLGLPVEDGKRIVPADAPTLAPYNPDWTSALSEALANRPELQIARHDVKAQQFNLMIQQNATRPDLRAFANYNVNSIGTQLTGNGPSSAFSNLGQDKFNNWSIGLRMNVVLGRRDAHAAQRSAQLNLARSYIVLKNQELKAERFLTGVYQNMHAYYRQMEATREQRIALGDQLRGLYARIQAGKDSLITILTAQQQFAAALSSEHLAIANYNIAIAGLQYAKGTLMKYDNIFVADGPLPDQTLVRAVEHERQRTEGLIVRERATLPSGDGPHPLPSLLEHQPPTPDTPPELKDPVGAMPFNPMAPAAPNRSMIGVSAAPIYSPTLPPTGRPVVLPVGRNP